jgi:hypothetical protein
VTKIYCLELFRASEGRSSRWSQLHLQSLVPIQFQGGLTSGRPPVVKIIAEALPQHDEEHVVPTTLSGIRVGLFVTQRNIMIGSWLTQDGWQELNASSQGSSEMAGNWRDLCPPM